MTEQKDGRKWFSEGHENFLLAKHFADDRETTVKLLTGFDDCVLGVATLGEALRVVYSVSQMVNVLAEDMERDEAYEYFNYNVVRSVEYDDSPDTPILIFDITEDVELEPGDGQGSFEPVPPASTN